MIVAARNDLKGLQSEIAGELGEMLPAIPDKAFKGQP
jgi:hypothetical protein